MVDPVKAGKSSPNNWPMFGGTPAARNMANAVDTKIPLQWTVDDGKQEHIKWVAELGSTAWGCPVIADGKVFVGTNNGNPRNPKIKGKDKAVLMALNEADGKFLWQIVHETPDADTFNAARGEGLCSTPVADGKRLYYVTPGCEVDVADTAGKVQWSFDMMKRLKVVPCHISISSPLIAGDMVLVITGNGADAEGNSSPLAPSFAAFHKNHGQARLAVESARRRIDRGAMVQSDARQRPRQSRRRSFPAAMRPLQLRAGNGQADMEVQLQSGTEEKARGPQIDNYIVATPVVGGDKLYIGLGPHLEHPTGVKHSYMLCLDVTKQGDVSLQSYDAKAIANKNSALVWAFGGPVVPRPRKGRKRQLRLDHQHRGSP